MMTIVHSYYRDERCNIIVQPPLAKPMLAEPTLAEQ
jgi:hypothetical protein